MPYLREIEFRSTLPWFTSFQLSKHVHNPKLTNLWRGGASSQFYLWMVLLDSLVPDDESLRDGDGVGNSRLGRAVIGGMQIWALDPHHLPPPVIPGCRKYLLFTLARVSDVASVLQPNIATFAIIAVQRKNKAAEFFSF